jgi:hypothetical protein
MPSITKINKLRYLYHVPKKDKSFDLVTLMYFLSYSTGFKTLCPFNVHGHATFGTMARDEDLGTTHDIHTLSCPLPFIIQTFVFAVKLFSP